MDSDIPMVDAAPVAAYGDLPTEAVVKGWTEEELYRFIQSQKSMRDSKNPGCPARRRIISGIWWCRGLLA